MGLISRIATSVRRCPPLGDCQASSTTTPAAVGKGRKEDSPLLPSLPPPPKGGSTHSHPCTTIHSTTTSDSREMDCWCQPSSPPPLWRWLTVGSSREFPKARGVAVFLGSNAGHRSTDKESSLTQESFIEDWFFSQCSRGRAHSPSQEG